MKPSGGQSVTAVRGQRRFYVAVRRNCPRRSLDAAHLHDYLRLNGWVAVHTPQAADLAIVWTCGGFDHTEAQSLRTIARAVGGGGRERRVIATGCLLKIHPEALDGHGAELLLSDDLAALDAVIGADMPFVSVPDGGIVPDVCDLVREPVSVRLKRQLRTVQGIRGRVMACLRYRLGCSLGAPDESRIIPEEAYQLLVARGCLNACSYCAIRIAMGRLRSRSLPEIMGQFKEALAEGHKLFALIAEDVGAYGVDRDLSVCDLLRELLSVPGDHRIIINDLNALWLVRYGNELVSILDRFRDRIEGLITPIQSGSDRILSLMRRGYEIGDVERVLGALNERVPDLHISTHIIAGFPSETEEDFQASLRLIQRNSFWHTDIFAYEERAMTPSANITPKCSPGVIARRTGALGKVVGECSGERRAQALTGRGF